MQESLKKIAAEAAIEYLEPDSIIGVGTGSTVNYFIEALAPMASKIRGAVVSSKASAEHLKKIGIAIFDTNEVESLEIYIDGADEINERLEMIKGGGGALTGEKIVASLAKKFICIADLSKKVECLGKFSIAIEVIPMARSYVAREIVKLGGMPIYRQKFITDHGNVILDTYNLNMTNPIDLENKLNTITGVVENGIFAKNKADILLLGTPNGVHTLTREN